METINNLVARAKSYWASSSPLSRALVIVGTILVVFGLSYAATYEPDHDLTPLADQALSLQQVGQITTELDKQGVSYKVTNDGTQVLVPRSKRGDLLASLASSGVSTQPESGTALESSLLATDFQQREQVRQHLERRLARDIASMTAIEWAEVHISPGSDSVFSRSNRKGAASVVVKSRAGFSFPKERAMSLKHLVAQAAHRYGVTSGTVTVVDHEARTLAAAEDDSEMGLSSKAITMQRETEDDLADRVRLLLEPIVGLGRVRVQVRTEMDLNQVEEHAEQYDPDNATVLSERKTSEAARTQRQDPAKVAGTQGNIPQAQAAANAARGQSRSNQDRAFNETNFAVPKVVRHTKHAIGSIERMSVAVLVDAAAFAPAANAPEGSPPPSVAPSSEEAGEVEADAQPEELPPRPNQEMLLALVRDAVAFDAKRGDTVTLSFQPFVRVRGEAAQVRAEEPGLSIPGWLPVTIVTLAGFVMVGAALYVSEKRRQKEAELAAEAAAEEERKKAEEEKEGPSPEMILKDEVKRITTENIAATIEIIKGWLSTTPQKG